MPEFEKHLLQLFVTVQHNPLDSDARSALQNWLDTNLDQFERWIPTATLEFGTTAERKSRRLDFLKHLLLSGYLPPRVETHSGVSWQTETINVAVLPSYFYSNVFSFLESGTRRSDVAVFVAQPHSSASPWVEITPKGVTLGAALMLEPDGLVWRRFTGPVPVHYLFPVDNYYKDKFRLVTEFAHCGVPMPGSTLIRDVCEDKTKLHKIIHELPGLWLPRERWIIRGDESAPWQQDVDEFCIEQQIHSLVSKPVDGFGGNGVAFWNYPEDRPAMMAHLDAALKNPAGILLQERIVAAPVHSGRDWNIRQYVVRRSEHDICAPYKRVRIGTGVINTEQGADSFLVDDLMAEVDLPPAQFQAFKATIDSTDQLAVGVMQCLTRYMSQNFTPTLYRGSGSNLEPDLLALDFMISPDPDDTARYRVVLLEINDFASGGMRDFEILIHRHFLPDAACISASQSYSLAPALLETARWRGELYRRETQQTQNRG